MGQDLKSLTVHLWNVLQYDPKDDHQTALFLSVSRATMATYEGDLLYNICLSYYPPHPQD